MLHKAPIYLLYSKSVMSLAASVLYLRTGFLDSSSSV